MLLGQCLHQAFWLGLYRQDAFDGKVKRYTPTGYVLDRKSNAVWGMQFVWPIKADYRIVYLAPDYSLTVIGREARDYVWIMARKPDVPETDYQGMLALLAREGYDVSRVQKVPQRWAVGRGIRQQAEGTP